MPALQLESHSELLVERRHQRLSFETAGYPVVAGQLQSHATDNRKMKTRSPPIGGTGKTPRH